MTVLCVIQARTGSTRFPGKVLADLGGRPMLRLMLDRLQRLAVDHLVVATSDLDRDDPVAELASDAGVPVVRGSETDVLERFVLATEQYPADLVVRLTADCPLSDPAVVEAAVALAEAKGADYASNSLVRTFPDGVDVEVLARTALEIAAGEAVDSAEREHVTPFIYRRTSRFSLAALRTPQLAGEERWTVDTAEDLERLRDVVASLEDPVTATWHDVLAAAGRRFQPPPGRAFLRPAVEDDPAATRRPRPLDDPSMRTWVAELDGASIGWAEVVALDGRGAATIDAPAHVRGDIEAELRRLLSADLQIAELEIA